MPSKLFGNLLQLDDTTNELQMLKGFLAQAASRIIGSADAVQLLVKGNSTQTSNLQEWQSSAGTVLSAIGPGGAWKPSSMADASAPNNSVYFSTTANKLVYKDSGGTVNQLY